MSSSADMAKETTEPYLGSNICGPDTECELDCLCTFLPNTSSPDKDNEGDLNVNELFNSIDLYLECDDDSCDDDIMNVAPSHLQESVMPSQAQDEVLSAKLLPPSQVQTEVLSGKPISYKLIFHLPQKWSGKELMKSYQCDKCQYKTSKERLVRNHKFLFHGIKGLFPCSQCKYVGNLHKHLQKHTYRVHGNLKTIKDEIKLKNDLEGQQAMTSVSLQQKPSVTDNRFLDSNVNIHSDCSEFVEEVNIPNQSERNRFMVETNIMNQCDLGNPRKLLVREESSQHENSSQKEACIGLPVMENYGSLSVGKDKLNGDTDSQPRPIRLVKNALTSTKVKCNKDANYNVRVKEEILHMCDQCPHESKSLRALKAHMICNHYGECPTYHCDQCPKVFKQRRSLQAHQAKHLGQMTYICAVENCRKLFASRDRIQNHMQRHKTCRPLQCGLCGKCFRSSRDLRQHIKVVHAEKIYRCTHTGCPKTYSTPSRLRAHQVTHSSAYQCTWPGCGRSFRDHFNLENHYHTHTGEKPLKCPWPLCNYTCIQQNSLDRHRAKKHGSKI